MISFFRILLPGFWLGLLVALAFIETPLKFLAPGITVPLALGIGRLVLSSAEIASVLLLLAISLLALLRSRLSKFTLGGIAAAWVVLLGQIFLIRTPLNARTDIVLAGGDPGSSPLHTIYVLSDLVLVTLIALHLVLVFRQTNKSASK